MQLYIHGTLAEHIQVGDLHELVASEFEVAELVYRYEQEQGEDNEDEVPF